MAGLTIKLSIATGRVRLRHLRRRRLRETLWGDLSTVLGGLNGGRFR
jgi:hypothetical protein